MQDNDAGTASRARRQGKVTAHLSARGRDDDFRHSSPHLQKRSSLTGRAEFYASGAATAVTGNRRPGSAISLTLRSGSGILKTLRGVAPGVCVCCPDPAGWTSKGFNRDRHLRLERKASSSRVRNPERVSPAVLTRTGLFGSGWKSGPVLDGRGQRRFAPQLSRRTGI